MNAGCQGCGDFFRHLRFESEGLHFDNAIIRTADIGHSSVEGGEPEDDRLALYQAKTGEPVSVLLPKSVVVALKDIRRKTDFFFWTGRSK